MMIFFKFLILIDIIFRNEQELNKIENRKHMTKDQLNPLVLINLVG